MIWTWVQWGRVDRQAALAHGHLTLLIWRALSTLAFEKMVHAGNHQRCSDQGQLARRPQWPSVKGLNTGEAR